MEKRLEFRNRKSLRVALDTGHGFVYGNSVNVSPGGVALTLRNKRVFKPGTKVAVNILKEGQSYTFTGEVRWFKFEILTNSLGVKFDNVNAEFCDNVLNLHFDSDAGPDNPFMVQFPNMELLTKQYMESMRFGGMFIPCAGEKPALDSVVWVDMKLPGGAEELKAEARVVIHQDDGFGVMFTNTSYVDRALKDYFQRSLG
ncbi:MAG: PilZ domain-containing protein [Acidobacteria bacterium]|nr:PilZ domain-containing protein [Acidobacteriota bacterium]